MMSGIRRINLPSGHPECFDVIIGDCTGKGRKEVVEIGAMTRHVLEVRLRLSKSLHVGLTETVPLSIIGKMTL